MSKKTEIQGRNDLMANVDKIGYHTCHKLGWIHFPEGEIGNMDGVVRLFSDIDQGVERILAFSGPILEVIYAKKDGLWEASVPK